MTNVKKRDPSGPPDPQGKNLIFFSFNKNYIIIHREKGDRGDRGDIDYYELTIF